jgi:pyruvate dehydrogenase E1 component
MGAGAILREVLAAAEILADEHGVDADVWSVTSFTELRRDGIEAERWSRLHPADAPALPYVGRMLADRPGPVVAASDYMRTVADQIRPFVPGDYHVLGTDGFGRSDTRAKLRSFFEVDRHHVVIAALESLARAGVFDRGRLAEAIERYDLAAVEESPWRR